MNKLLVLIVIGLQSCHIWGFGIQPRIVNGILSDPNLFKYFVQIKAFGADTQTSCGGSILNDRWLLTAGHCLQPNMEMVAYAGIDRDGEFRTFVRLNASSLHMHPAFVRDTLAHDIGLIELPTPLKVDRFIEAATLPADCGEDLVDESAYTAGVGAKTFNEHYYDEDSRIHHANLIVTANAYCQRLLRHSTDVRSIICAYSRSPHDMQTPYHGDSGGPLVRSSDKTLIGVTSYAQIANNRVATVDGQIYTKIHYYFNWISMKTGIKLPECNYPWPMAAQFKY